MVKALPPTHRVPTGQLSKRTMNICWAKFLIFNVGKMFFISILKKTLFLGDDIHTLYMVDAIIHHFKFVFQVSRIPSLCWTFWIQIRSEFANAISRRQTSPLVG